MICTYRIYTRRKVLIPLHDLRPGEVAQSCDYNGKIRSTGPKWDCGKYRYRRWGSSSQRSFEDGPWMDDGPIGKKDNSCVLVWRWGP